MSLIINRVIINEIGNQKFSVQMDSSQKISVLDFPFWKLKTQQVENFARLEENVKIVSF